MKKISQSMDAYDAVKGMVQHPTQEEVFIITTDNHNGIIACHLVGLGSDMMAVIPRKEIARIAIMDIARGVVLIHTHPHGNPSPSEADIRETEALKKALGCFDISLLDHIIIGDGCYYSFYDGYKTVVK